MLWASGDWADAARGRLDTEVDCLSRRSRVLSAIDHPKGLEDCTQSAPVLLDVLDEATLAHSVTPASVMLNIYDLNERFVVANEVLAFSSDALPSVGGAFHVGVETYGSEWSYGRKGVSSEPPRAASGHVYRCSVLLGKTHLSKMEFAALLHSMCLQWRAADYGLIGHNCCSFARELCERLNVGPMPHWVDRFARMLHGGQEAGKALVHGATMALEAFTSQIAGGVALALPGSNQSISVTGRSVALSNMDVFCEDADDAVSSPRRVLVGAQASLVAGSGFGSLSPRRTARREPVQEQKRPNAPMARRLRMQHAAARAPSPAAALNTSQSSSNSSSHHSRPGTASSLVSTRAPSSSLSFSSPYTARARRPSDGHECGWSGDGSLARRGVSPCRWISPPVSRSVSPAVGRTFVNLLSDASVRSASVQSVVGGGGNMFMQARTSPIRSAVRPAPPAVASSSSMRSLHSLSPGAASMGSRAARSLSPRHPAAGMPGELIWLPAKSTTPAPASSNTWAFSRDSRGREAETTPPRSRPLSVHVPPGQVNSAPAEAGSSLRSATPVGLQQPAASRGPSPQPPASSSSWPFAATAGSSAASRTCTPANAPASRVRSNARCRTLPAAAFSGTMSPAFGPSPARLPVNVPAAGDCGQTPVTTPGTGRRLTVSCATPTSARAAGMMPFGVAATTGTPTSATPALPAYGRTSSTPSLHGGMALTASSAVGKQTSITEVTSAWTSLARAPPPPRTYTASGFGERKGSAILSFQPPRATTWTTVQPQAVPAPGRQFAGVQRTTKMSF
eukprot:TRINITY_DN43836_c0_g2_i2.p1 TRINITY_DN43836_c0_g2~~TRINITY_DN43836_c0_g2_i2.p1  ORF type:complete len:793 (-),score=128.62 TRINITY_DN43836_c0_g2_i2:80-2458(-)